VTQPFKIIRRRVLVGILLAMALHVGCVSYRPIPLSQLDFHDRLRFATDGEVTVAAAVLGPEETRKTFAVDLYAKGVQPVYVKIDNQSSSTFIFFERSVDPHYFSPLEAAYQAHVSVMAPFYQYGLSSAVMWPLLPFVPIRAITAGKANSEMDEYFDDAGIGNESISPGEQLEGFIFTHIDPGAKKVPVTLYGAEEKRSFTVIVKVPETHADHELVAFDSVCNQAEYIRHDWESLVERLQTMPCCSTNQTGAVDGDPANLILVGSLKSILEAFTLAGWDETEPLSFGTAWRTARSFMKGESYRTSPVSSLYFFNRPQDMALQKARETVHARNHLRLWQTPWLVEEERVWVGQVSRDIGVRPTLKTWNLTTHKIDPDIDDARDNVLGDLVATGRVSAVGFIKGVGVHTAEAPGRNLTGDPYYTDGERLLMCIKEEETPLHLFDWRKRKGKLSKGYVIK